MGRTVAGAVGVVAVLVLIITFFSINPYSTPSDMVAVHVGAGPIEASKVKGDCIPTSERGFITNDDYEYFPTSEREWDATGQQGSDSGRFESVTKDSVEMYVPVTVRFTLVTECDTLKDFYTRYARRFGVEFKNDGTFDETGANYNQQWLVLLRKLIADPSDATLDRIIQDYNWRQVWNDPETKVEIEKRFNDALQSETSLLVQTAKGTFFDGISVLVGKPEPVNEELAVTVASEQTRVSEAQAAEAQAKADRAKALAEVAVAKAEAAKQRATIAGFGGVDGYLKYLAVSNETNPINPWQPTYVVSGTAPGR